jgi:serine/threonine protein kinase
MLTEGQCLHDRYDLQRQLSHKVDRQTFLARDRTTQSAVVIKVLYFGQGVDWSHFRLFEREAETLRQIVHPSIPQYLDFFEVDLPDCKGYALVQTYIQALSLAEFLRAGRTFSETEIEQIADQLLSILSDLHEGKLPVIHRDIKPSNILLGDRSGNLVGRIYLVDFGTVQNFVPEQGSTFTVVGTYGYTPLEQFGGRALPASDLYSVGMTLIHLLTGTYPSDLPKRDGKVQLDQVPHLSIGFGHWLKQMVEPELHYRFSSATLALRALRQIHQAPALANTRRQPDYSKIVVNSGVEGIEVFIPSVGFHLSAFCLSLFYFCFSVPFLPFLLFPVIGWFFVGALIWLTLNQWRSFLFDWFGQTHLRLTSEQIILSYKIWGLSFKKPAPAPRSAILKLERIEPHVKRTASSDGFVYTNVAGSIVVWAGNRKYELGNLTVPELDWVGQELSVWLKLPVESRVLPTVQG